MWRERKQENGRKYNFHFKLFDSQFTYSYNMLHDWKFWHLYNMKNACLPERQHHKYFFKQQCTIRNGWKASNKRGKRKWTWRSEEGLPMSRRPIVRSTGRWCCLPALCWANFSLNAAGFVVEPWASKEKWNTEKRKEFETPSCNLSAKNKKRNIFKKSNFRN